MAKVKTKIERMSKNFCVVKSGGMTWINISKPTRAYLNKLRGEYPFLLDIDLKDCLPPFQRPKLLERGDYIFMVLLYPIYDPKTKTVRPVEVDFFVGKNFIVTSHAGQVEPLLELARDCAGNSHACSKRLGDDAPTMMYNILHELLISVFPILTKLTNDILISEQRIFDESGHDTVRQILRIKSNIVQCRQAMQGHRMVIKKFVERSSSLFRMGKMTIYYDDLIGHTKEIWDYLKNDRDTIDAVYDSHTSLVTHSTSQASQRLAALALIIFPTTLAATVFTMAADNVPIQGHPYDFWIMLALVLMVMFGTIAYLKWKRWL